MELHAPSLCPAHDQAVDVDELRAFLLVDRDLSAATVAHRLRALRHMATTGFDWPRFRSSPAAALAEGRRWLAEKKLASGRSTLHNYELVLNDVARHQTLTDPSFDAVWFQHTKPRYGHPDPYTPGELARLAGYRCGDPFVERRRRALIWLALNTRLRKSELHSLDVDDLDHDQGVLHVRHPAKGGKPRSIPMPRETWSGRRPVQAYLAARRRVLDGRPGGLWVSRTGASLGINMLAKETMDLSRELDFTVSFNRFRRTGTTRLFQAGVGLPTVQYLLGHHNPRSTMWYYEPTADDARRDLARCGIGGFAEQPELQAAHHDQPDTEALLDTACAA